MKKTIFIILVVLLGSCDNSEKQISVMERVKPILSRIQLPELMLDVKILSESFPDSKPSESLIPILRKQNINDNACFDEESVYEYGFINAPVNNLIDIKEVYDNNPNTCFTSKNSGLDEYLIFRIQEINKKTKRKDYLPYAMKIINGNAKDKDSFFSYNRIKRARFELYEVPTKTDFEKSVKYLLESDIKLRYVSEFELYDTTNWQRVLLNFQTNIRNYPIGRLIILDVYRGATNQTCISELRWIYF